MEEHFADGMERGMGWQKRAETGVEGVAEEGWRALRTALTFDVRRLARLFGNLLGRTTATSSLPLHSLWRAMSTRKKVLIQP